MRDALELLEDGRVVPEQRGTRALARQREARGTAAQCAQLGPVRCRIVPLHHEALDAEFGVERAEPAREDLLVHEPGGRRGAEQRLVVRAAEREVRAIHLGGHERRRDLGEPGSHHLDEALRGEARECLDPLRVLARDASERACGEFDAERQAVGFGEREQRPVAALEHQRDVGVGQRGEVEVGVEDREDGEPAHRRSLAISPSSVATTRSRSRAESVGKSGSESSSR